METSFVWKHFSRDSRESATCKFCKKELKCKGSSTTGLRRHLKSIHNFHHFGRKAALESESSSESMSNAADEKKPVVSQASPSIIAIRNDLDAQGSAQSTEYFDFSIESANNSTLPEKAKRNVLLELVNMQKEKKDEDALFFESFLPSIRNLALQDKMQFKMEFQQLLYKYMFKESDQA
ncbi:uncharacterized protein LOC132257261 [Phlebotomus argentipes]|uniref:uncharacterized protein LOC132257261 n=1 Tax=Phlebotomus argentipes TaxID=94469 RepID=UPI002892C8CF|nr:uncharacterized protein LOC132257261 [Phlebotomus argentipes]